MSLDDDLEKLFELNVKVVKYANKAGKLADRLRMGISKEKPAANKTRLEHAELIWQAYPLKADKPSSIKAISNALRRESFEHLLEQTKAFANIPDAERLRWRAQGFFNREIYNDDPSTWVFECARKQERKGTEKQSLPIGVRNKIINRLNERKARIIRTFPEGDYAEWAEKELADIQRQLEKL